MSTDSLPHDTGPGCGLAAYAILLLVLAAASILGMTVSTFGMLTSDGVVLSELKTGSQVATWQLQPMRDAGVAALAEVPLAWHDESPVFDGTTACALFEDRLARVEDGAGLTIAYADVRDMQASGDEDKGVVATFTGPDGAKLSCSFKAKEGGTRFVRQVLVETDKAGADLPHITPLETPAE